MSFAEVMAEIPNFSSEQLRALMSRAKAAEKTRELAANPLRLKNIDGRVIIESSRVIRQAEIERILDEFP